MNITFIIGNVGQEPTNRPYGENKENDLAVFTVAVNKQARRGQEQDPEWYNVKVFGGLAGPVLKYLKKGHKVAVVGRLESNMGTGDYEGRKFTDLIASEVEFLTPRDPNAPAAEPAQAGAPAKAEGDLPF